MSTYETVRPRRREPTIVSRRGLLTIGGGVIAAALVESPGPVFAQAKTAAATIDNFAFTPAVLEVTVGTTVTWTNRDDIPHTVTDKSIAWRSKALDTDDTFSHTFDTAGEFQYFCSLHPHMTGTVVVKP